MSVRSSEFIDISETGRREKRSKWTRKKKEKSIKT
jgi:hypothetical protein